MLPRAAHMVGQPHPLIYFLFRVAFPQPLGWVVVTIFCALFQNVSAYVIVYTQWPLDIIISVKLARHANYGAYHKPT